MKPKICPGQRNALPFEEGVFERGLRTKDKVALPSRAIAFVKVTEQKDADLIATLPSNLDKNILLVNSIDEITNDGTSVLLANLDT